MLSATLTHFGSDTNFWMRPGTFMIEVNSAFFSSVSFVAA